MAVACMSKHRYHLQKCNKTLVDTGISDLMRPVLPPLSLNDACIVNHEYNYLR